MNANGKPAGETALIMIDVVRGFFSPSGSLYYATAVDIVPTLRTLLSAARGQERLVVHVGERHRAELDDFEFEKIPPHFPAGGPDSEFFDDIRPDGPCELALPKRRYSAFFATDLDLLLREQTISTLVVAGVKTNVCVRATVQDAFALGYRVLLPREATNSNRPHLAEASLEDIDRYFGDVVSLDRAIEALR